MHGATSRVLDWSWGAIGLIVLGAIAWRLPVGVDLGDESYYAVFNLWWSTAEGIASPSQSLHSTASSLTQPLVWVWWHLREFDGLVLFLRLVWLAAALSCAAIAGVLASRLRSPGYALPAALFVLVFVPFAIVAPSYNTLGVLGLTAGLSLALIAQELRLESNHRLALVSGLLSGCALSLGAIAYPTLSIATLVFALLLLHPVLRGVFVPVISGLAFIALIWLLYVTLILRFSVVDSYRTTSAMKFGEADLSAKLSLWSAQITQQQTFLSLLVVALILGSWWRVRRQTMRNEELLIWVSLAVSMLIFSYSQGPVLFARSHDLVVLLAVLGLPTVGLGSSKSLGWRHEVVVLIKVSFVVSWLAGFLTAYSAEMGLLNLALGLFPSALITLLALAGVGIRSGGRVNPIPFHALSITAVVLLLASLLTNVYGDSQVLTSNSKVRIASGPYAGLLTSESKSRDMAEIQEAIQRSCSDDSSQLMVGSPGLYLLSVREPRALTPWNQSYQAPEFKRQLKAYYSREGARPKCIGVLEGAPIAEIEVELLQSLSPSTPVELSGSQRFTVFSAKPVSEVTLD